MHPASVSTEAAVHLGVHTTNAQANDVRMPQHFEELNLAANLLQFGQATQRRLFGVVE